MSDPFDKLRHTDATIPDVSAIKARAQRIQRRRYAGLAGGAVAIAIVAVVGIIVSSGPGEVGGRRLAFESGSSPKPTVAPKRELDETTAAEARGAPAAKTVPQDASERASTFSSESGASAAALAGAESSRGAAVQDAPSGMQVTLDVIEESAQPRRGVGFSLKACNRSSEPVDVTFASGQRYDFEVSRDGKLVWRWSDGRAFAQVYGEESWGPGQCKTYSEWWDGTNSDGAPSAPGRYEAVGILTSSPPIRSASKSFCLDAC